MVLCWLEGAYVRDANAIVEFKCRRMESLVSFILKIVMRQRDRLVHKSKITMIYHVILEKLLQNVYFLLYCPQQLKWGCAK